MGNSQHRLPRSQIQALTKETHFNKHELQRWYASFVEDCPTAEMSVAQFLSLFGRFHPGGDARAFAGYVFRAFDQDGSGTISFREFVCALSILSRGSLEEKCEWSFRLFDFDGDGVITAPEMEQVFASIFALVGPGSVDLPPDEDTAAKRVAKIFALMDVDNDASLSRQEFTAGTLSDQSIVRALSLFQNCV